jgi:hypothetical protein
MLDSAVFTRGNADSIALEVYAERAGAALACAFSSSAEFEAALIATRRAAGVYGPRRYRRRFIIAACAIVAAVFLVGLSVV